MKHDAWKHKAHLNMGGRGVFMEVKKYRGIELYRELGCGKPIYYIKSSKKNFPDEESLINHIESTPQQ